MHREAPVAIVLAPMISLQSYVCGQWTAGSGDPVALHDPSTAEVIGDVRPGGVDFAASLDHARDVGGPALRALSFPQRAAALKAISKVIHANRDELIEIANGPPIQLADPAYNFARPGRFACVHKINFRVDQGSVSLRVRPRAPPS